VALGFPQAAGGAGQPPRCRSVIAHRLQLLYNDVLRGFEKHASGSNQSTQIRRLTQEDLVAAKRLVNEKKRMAFSCGQFSLLCLPRLSFVSV
jgi:hypothetical protein